MSASGDDASSAKDGGRPGQYMTPQQAYEFGFARESWCVVEMKKEQDWCRATRRHFGENFKSKVFNAATPVDAEPRCTWSVNAPTHRERRHFGDKYDNQLKL